MRNLLPCPETSAHVFCPNDMPTAAARAQHGGLARGKAGEGSPTPFPRTQLGSRRREPVVSLTSPTFHQVQSNRGLRPPGQRGAALIVVLSCLVLVAIVVVAFMAGSATERTASRSYAEGGRARLLAQSAMDLVQGQIWAATTQTNASWASQPGAIRTFTAGNTNIANVFKLYSSATMVADGTYNAGTTNAPTEIPADWAARPNQFVDLNRPVFTAAGTNFPILDPTAKGVVAGFDYTASWGSATNLPMPVQWMYQLKDGTLSAMDSAGKVANATAANPIVGRLAFWADDDTCKININTAGEGAFWDVPRGDNSRVAAGSAGNANAVYALDSERSFAQFQPAQREYQRYPGHPATVSLKSVFPSLLADEIYNLTPRINSDDAGSNLSDPTPSNWRRPTAPLALKINAATGKPYRLYASLDELLFAQASTGSPPVRTLNTPGTEISPANITRLAGVLTAYNRSAEMNLFGKPRVSMWPVNSSTANRTPIDKWFATCSTIGGEEFFVKRSDSKAMATDGALNLRLFNYLDGLAGQSVPGFGGSIASKLGAANASQTIALALDYIRCTNLLDTSDISASSTVRPFAISNNFSAYDIFNGTPNAFFGYFGAGQALPMEVGGRRGLGRFDTVTEVGIVFHSMMWNSRSAPIPNGENAENPVRQGEFAGADVAATQSAPPSDNFNAFKANAPMYRAIFLIEPGNVGQGFPQANMDYTYTIEGLDGVEVNGVPIGFPANETEPVRGGTYGAGSVGGYSGSIDASLTRVNDGWITAINPKDGRGTSTGSGGSSNPALVYKFISLPFPISGALNAQGEMVSASSFNFKAAKQITLSIKSNSGVEVQKFTFQFPDAVLPTPLPGNPWPSGLNFSRSTLGRRNHIHWAGQTAFLQNEDTVISLEPSGKALDLRWLSLQPVVDVSVFQPHSKYPTLTQSTTGNKANSFRREFQSSMSNSQAVYGKLIQGVTTGAPADLPASVDGVFTTAGLLGDWDTGVGDSRDGAYINRADEGNTRYSAVAGDNSRLPYFSFGGFSDKVTPGFETYFAPNRQVPSSGMLGSLPSRMATGDVWETLLFNPNPAAGDSHRGFGNPPDFIWMDLFTMPVIEPYAISEPFSSAGKINLNFQMVPFTYIERSTALRALFAGNRVAAIHDGAAATFKNGGTQAIFRHKINATETLKQFMARFDAGGIFRSGAEICSLDLYPVVTAQNMPSGGADQPSYDASRSSIKTWWSTRRLTGDNLREQPYTTLYQSLSTQSNTYTIHVWAQAIQKPPGSPVDEMTSRDAVTGEYRVAYSIERFIDSNNPNLPDFAQAGSPNTSGFYQFRVNNTKQFSP